MSNLYNLLKTIIEKLNATVKSVNGKTGDITLNASDVGADASGTAESKVSTHNTSIDSHSDIRLLISGLTNRLNALADSDDVTLDQLSEVVAYIKSNRDLISSITTSKVNVEDIIDNLTTNVANKPLSAAQGVALKDLIDAISIPEVDETLSESGKAADAATVGDRLSALSNEIANLPQPDWNQNDSTAADYVKNRPFYTGDPVENIFVEESTVSFAVTGNGQYEGQIQSTFIPTVGETYKVSWDGADYECTCIESNGVFMLGDLNIIFGVHDPADEPFLIGAPNGEKLWIIAVDSSASHTFSVVSRELVAQVVKIDEKYLPDALLSFKPAGKSYLTFSSPNNFILSVHDLTKHWNGTLEYFASDKTWTTWDGTSALSAVAYDGEYVLYLRGTGNTAITGNSQGYRWVLTGTDIKCIGNIENLLDYATVESGDHPTMTANCYAYMFYGCTSLTQAPALPATTLANYCYSDMFYGCTSLTQAPALPATTLVNSCYSGMFGGCTSLKLSSTQTDEYTQEYRIPSSGNGVTATDALRNMFTFTGGTFTGTPEINTTYYLSSDNMVVRKTDIATLNGYVGSMINAALNAIGVAEKGAY